MSERKPVPDYINLHGEEKAKRNFGDSLFEKATRDLNDLTQRRVTALEDLQQRFEKYFPKT